MKKTEWQQLRRIGLTVVYVAVVHGAVFLLFTGLVDDEWHWGGKLSYFAWPSILLAQFGLSHTWGVSAVILPADFAVLTYVTVTNRSRWPMWKRGLLTCLIPAACLLGTGWMAIDAFPNPLPDTTPYDGEPAAREVYLERWDKGFLVGKMGWGRTYCFAPDIDTKGHYDGMAVGRSCWERTIGEEMAPDTIPVLCLDVCQSVADRWDNLAAFLPLVWQCRPELLGGEDS